MNHDLENHDVQNLAAGAGGAAESAAGLQPQDAPSVLGQPERPIAERSSDELRAQLLDFESGAARLAELGEVPLKVIGQPPAHTPLGGGRYHSRGELMARAAAVSAEKMRRELSARGEPLPPRPGWAPLSARSASRVRQDLELSLNEAMFEFLRGKARRNVRVRTEDLSSAQAGRWIRDLLASGTLYRPLELAGVSFESAGRELLVEARRNAAPLEQASGLGLGRGHQNQETAPTSEAWAYRLERDAGEASQLIGPAELRGDEDARCALLRALRARAPGAWKAARLELPRAEDALLSAARAAWLAAGQPQEFCARLDDPGSDEVGDTRLGRGKSSRRRTARPGGVVIAWNGRGVWLGPAASQARYLDL